MANTNLGKVSVTPRGAYQAAAHYKRLDVVAYNGGSFLALRDVTGVTPVDGADWMQIANRGATGPQGEKGNPGANATINGIESMQIVAGDGLVGKQSGDTFAIGMFDAPELHRMVFRGKNLGDAVTEAQKANIQDGTFRDLWLGDYWTIHGVNWRIVDFDYWFGCGDIAFTKHHLVIMPDKNLGDPKQMNENNTTEGGYVGSLMYTTNMADAKAACMNAFGANILTHREYLVNAVSDGKPSAGAWMESTIELPNACMIYGHLHLAPGVYTIDKTQLALFAAVPKFITTRHAYWLRDVVSSASFAVMNSGGAANYGAASYATIGVRPVFPVGV